MIFRNTLYEHIALCYYHLIKGKLSRALNTPQAIAPFFVWKNLLLTEHYRKMISLEIWSASVLHPGAWASMGGKQGVQSTPSDKPGSRLCSLLAFLFFLLHRDFIPSKTGTEGKIYSHNFACSFSKKLASPQPSIYFQPVHAVINEYCH